MGALRVIIASRIYAPEPAAASFRLQALARAIARAGGRVLVLTSSVPASVRNDQPTENDEPQHGSSATNDDSRIQVRRAPVLRNSEGYLRGYIPYMSFDIPLFFRLLSAPRPDVVICEPPPTTGFVTRIVTSMRRIPYVYYAADIWSDAASNTAPDFVVKVLRGVENWVLSGASQVIAATEALGDRLEEMGHTQVTVAPNGVDTEVFTVAGPLPDIDTPYVVYAGTASEWHGAEIFAQAMKEVITEVPQARLVFLGQGSAWPQIERIAQELPEDTIMQMGRLNPADAATWQRGAAAALASVKPGAGYDFAIPTKAYSGLAVGRPVIYTGPGPLREVIEAEKLGTVVDYNVHDVARAMIDALKESSHARVASDGATHHARAKKLAGEPPSSQPAERNRFSEWVGQHHSLIATGELALRGVHEAIKRYRDKK